MMMTIDLGKRAVVRRLRFSGDRQLKSKVGAPVFWPLLHESPIEPTVSGRDEALRPADGVSCRPVSHRQRKADEGLAGHGVSVAARRIDKKGSPAMKLLALIGDREKETEKK